MATTTIRSWMVNTDVNGDEKGEEGEEEGLIYIYSFLFSFLFFFNKNNFNKMDICLMNSMSFIRANDFVPHHGMKSRSDEINTFKCLCFSSLLSSVCNFRPFNVRTF